MGVHTRSIGLLGLLLALVFGVVAFAAPTPKPGPGLVAIRAAAPLVGVASLGLIVFARRRDDPAPDYLRQMFRRRYDCNGLGFALDMEARHGVAWIDVYLQNRYDRHCTGTIRVSRAHGLVVSDRRSTIATISVHCHGGELAIVSVPIGVPAKYQGRRKPFKLDAEVTYPGKRGAVLRHTPGRRVGAHEEHPVLVTLASVFLGVFGLLLAAGASSPARVRLRYPSDVGTTVDPPHAVSREILWLPGDEPIDPGLVDAAEESGPGADDDERAPEGHWPAPEGEVFQA